MIAAIDPGSHLAIAYVHKKVPISQLQENLHTEAWKLPIPAQSPAALIYEHEMRMCRKAVALIEKESRNRKLHLLIEDFSPRMMNKTRAFLSPVRTTVILLTLLRTNEIPFTYDLPPSSTMANVTDDRLKTLGLWTPGSPHIRAATKHLVSYLRK